MLAGIGHFDCFFHVGGSPVWYPLLGEDSGPGLCKTRSGFALPFPVGMGVPKSSEGRVIRRMRQKRPGLDRLRAARDGKGTLEGSWARCSTHTLTCH